MPLNPVLLFGLVAALENRSETTAQRKEVSVRPDRNPGLLLPTGTREGSNVPLPWSGLEVARACEGKETAAGRESAGIREPESVKSSEKRLEGQGEVVGKQQR